MARPTDDPRYENLGFSLSSKDAVDTGLFSDGPATILESIFAAYDYSGTNPNPPVVWLVKYGRGEGRDQETHQQAYTIGKGWQVDKKGKVTGPGVLPRTCNAILYLVNPLEHLLDTQNIELPPNGLTNPRAIEGMEVELKRIKQVERNIPDSRRAVGGRKPEPGVEKSPSTILTIDRILSVPWSGEQPAKPKPAAKAAAKAASKPQAAPQATSDDDEDEAPPVQSKPNGKASRPAPVPVATSQARLTEEAVEAVVKLVEGGPVKVAQLEPQLEKLLAEHPQAPAIIDLATSNRFLMSEQGWSLSKDGKTLDAAVAE